MDINNDLNQTAPVNFPVAPPVVESSQAPFISSNPQSPPLQPISTEPKKGFSKKMTIALIIILVILIVSGVFGYSYFKTAKDNMQIATSVKNTNKENAKLADQGKKDKTATVTSDSQIDKDLQSVDETLNSADKNAAAVDQGLNDQQVNLQ